jgi:hypothetical protein
VKTYKHILFYAIFFFLSLPAEITFTQGYLNFPIDTIVRDSFYNYRSMVKFDNSGFIHSVNTRQYDTPSDTREIFYRTNKTGSMVTTRLTNNTVDDNYASFGFDNSLNVHIGWERRDASNNFQLIYSNNRGGSFMEPVWITTGGLNKATPFMAVGKNDSLVHFVYYTFVTGQDNAYYRWYNYVTGTLGPEVSLGPAETGSENDIEIAVDNNNKLHIVFSTNVNINGGALKYFTNEGGPLVEVPTGISANSEYPDIVISNSNVLHIAYRLSTDKRIYLIRKPSGGALETPIPVTPSGIGNPAYWRAIDTDDNGRFYMTFQNSVAAGPKGFFLVHGTGSSFSSPILIFEDSTSSYSTRGSSSVAAKGNGEIVVFFDPAGLRNGVVISDIFMKRGTLNLTGISPVTQSPGDFILFDNFPNPFNPGTKIKFSIGTKHASRRITLNVYDVSGKKAASLINGYLKSGTYEISFDGTNHSSGVYFYKLSDGITTLTKKMILVK